MMKVVHLTSVHKRYDTRIFYKECLSLLKEHSKVYLVLNDGLGNEKRDEVEIIDIGFKEKNRFIRMTVNVFKICKESININADIYHFHDPELIPIGLLLKLKGKKVIYDVHEDVASQVLSKDWIPKFSRKIISYVFNKFEKNASRFFDSIITVTSNINNLFLPYNKKSYVVNNYPILNTSNFDLSYWEKKDKNICYVGGITKIRGIKYLIESLEELDVKLILAGEFSSDAFKKELTSLKGWGKVDYRGLVDRKGVYEILKSSMAGVVTFLPKPNHINAQPNKMFEYMLAGIPVIASNFSLWKEIIERNDCGICVDPKNPKEIALAIKYILANPEKVKTMGLNGRKAVEEKYNWGIEEKKLLEVYRNLL